jgi:hypothetical protein
VAGDPDVTLVRPDRDVAVRDPGTKEPRGYTRGDHVEFPMPEKNLNVDRDVLERYGKALEGHHAFPPEAGRPLTQRLRDRP